MEEFKEAIKRFNEELDEGIKHLIGTTKLIDPYDIEEGKITKKEAQEQIKEKGFQIFALRDPYHPNRMSALLYEKETLIAGVDIRLDLKTLEVKRRMALVDDDSGHEMSDYAAKFIKAMKN
jgi:hypothetical protein